ncbi:MAG: hypothetical protein D6814_12480 [Calditrichaeota bacterium]|nr:MAG: hypothetical protein D6814_12480 [Calditrichota bacterium]
MLALPIFGVRKPCLRISPNLDCASHAGAYPPLDCASHACAYFFSSQKATSAASLGTFLKPLKRFQKERRGRLVPGLKPGANEKIVNAPA